MVLYGAVMERKKLNKPLLLCWSETWERWGLESKESSICKLLGPQLGALLLKRMWPYITYDPLAVSYKS